MIVSSTQPISLKNLRLKVKIDEFYIEQSKII